MEANFTANVKLRLLKKETVQAASLEQFQANTSQSPPESPYQIFGCGSQL
jgi:hypothetical protein